MTVADHLDPWGEDKYIQTRDFAIMEWSAVIPFDLAERLLNAAAVVPQKQIDRFLDGIVNSIRESDDRY